MRARPAVLGHAKAAFEHRPRPWGGAVRAGANTTGNSELANWKREGNVKGKRVTFGLMARARGR
jgi:hypothetical protein